MNVFYIDIDKYLPDDNILLNYGDRKFLSVEKERQHCLGRFLVKKIAKEFYNIENTEIEIVNKKPRFKNSSLKFSISHSQNIVLAAFDNNPVGADVEFMKDRDFKAIFERYNYKGDNKELDNKELFYKFWTQYEAGIKLQGSAKTTITIPFKENFVLSVAGNFDENYRIIELNKNGFNYDGNPSCK